MYLNNGLNFLLCGWEDFQINYVFMPTKLDTTSITNVISGMNVIKRKMTKNVSSSIAQNASFSDHHNSKRKKRCQVTNHISKGGLHCPSTVSNKNIHFRIDKRDKGLIGLGKNPCGSLISLGQELLHALEDSSRIGFRLGLVVIPADPIIFLRGLEAKDCLSYSMAPVQGK